MAREERGERKGGKEMRTYLVIVKEEFRKECFACGGTGKKNTTVSGRRFVHPCSYCGGTGYTVGNRTTEVPLVDALKEIGTSREWMDFRVEMDMHLKKGAESKSDRNTDTNLPSGDDWLGELVKRVAGVFDVPVELVKSFTRKREVVEVRYLLFWYLSEVVDWSHRKIGAAFGGFDRNTVRRGIDCIKQWTASDKVFLDKFNRFQTIINER